MSARDLARNSPYLRRYARALTGSQIEGDAAVEATLRRILGGGLDLDLGLSPKTGLFRAFHQAWQGSSAAARPPRPSFAPPTAVSRR